MNYINNDIFGSSSNESDNEELNVKSNRFLPKETEIIKRRTNVGPWKNKEEFDSVYLSLFGPKASKKTKAEACNKMTVWELRSVIATPAAISSTLVLTEVQLKDDDTRPIDELQSLYAGAFTRFLNFMASTSQNRNRKMSMYQIAMKVGIDPFIVDIRHLCSHGRKIPSLDVLRTSSEYCIDWLKGYYWDHEYLNMVNVRGTDIRKKNITEFDDHVTRLFQIYDIAIVGEFNDCKNIDETAKYLNQDNFKLLKKYGKTNGKIYIDQVKDSIIKNLENVTRRNSTFKLAEIFIEAFCKMVFIFEIPVSLCKTKVNRQHIIKNTRKLFRSIAIYGFIDTLFEQLMLIAENNSEPETKRKGASFWANEIVIGFIAFDKFKFYCKEQKDKDENFEIKNKDLYNIDSLPKEVKKIYAHLGYDTNSIILFGDHFKRPWSLSFTTDDIEERLKNICTHTKKIVKNCLSLVDPKLPRAKINKLEEIIKIYCSTNFNNDNDENNDKKSDNEPAKIYHLDEDMEMIIEKDNSEIKEKKYGIWSIVDDDEDWHLCPLGRLPWD